jgi:hypothetical protein
LPIFIESKPEQSSFFPDWALSSFFAPEKRLAIFSPHRLQQGVKKMKSEINEIVNGNNGRFGAIKDIGLTLKLPGFNVETRPGLPEAAYRISEGCRNHLTEVEYQKARARTEVQRFQFNR